MLAVKLHNRPRVSLGKNACLVPIVDWRSGRVLVRQWLRSTRDARYLTLVRIPPSHPVCLHFFYGPDTFMRQVVWPSEFMPLREWPPEFLHALGEWWDAWRDPHMANSEPGGLMVEEPDLVLGAPLPDACIRWTKDVRLLYGPRRRD